MELECMGGPLDGRRMEACGAQFSLPRGPVQHPEPVPELAIVTVPPRTRCALYRATIQFGEPVYEYAGDRIL